MILTIDPGLNNCGLSVCSHQTNKLIVHHTELVTNERRFSKEEKVLEKSIGIRTIKVLHILNKIKDILTEYKIDEVVYESPFYNPRMPTAYASLLEVIHAIKYNIIIPSNTPLKSIEPLLIKKLFTTKSQASKELMKEFLIKKLNNNEIVLPTDITCLSEHEIDSVAVAYCYFLERNTKES